MRLINQVVFRMPLFSIKGNIHEDAMEEAIYLSSPVLQRELKKTNSKSDVSEKEKRKQDISVYKYQSRASHRCTPFGLYAGLGIVKFGLKNEIIIDDDLYKSLSRNTKLDMHVVCGLSRMIENDKELRPFIKYFKNSSLYRVGDTYRYIEFLYKNNHRSYKISKVDFNEYLEYILDSVKLGLNEKELLDLLTGEGIDESEAKDFLNEIIDSQILTTQFEPNVIGTDFFNVIHDNLTAVLNESGNERIKYILGIVRRVQSMMAEMDINVLNSIKAYSEIFNNLVEILPALSESNLFQVDSFRQTKVESEIDEKIRSKLEKCLVFLNKITPPDVNTGLDQFIVKFRERFEDREMPLLFVLDKETGIGFPDKDTAGINVLINDITFRTATNSNEIKWSNLQSCLLELIIRSREKNLKIIKISDDDFKTVDYSNIKAGLSLPVLYNVIDANESKILFKNAGGSSAVNFVGRFASKENGMLSLVNEITEHEKNLMPDRVFAEIGHLPEDRTGNVIARQEFRQYEIPYLARSIVDESLQISGEDLMISIKNNKIILRSKKLNKEIIPRLGNAHNYAMRALPVYHFLCEMQFHYIEKRALYFTWGVLGNLFSFFPRIEYYDSVLCPATWKLSTVDILKLNAKATEEKKMEVFKDVIKRNDIPDKFLVSEGDNEMLIDTNNNLSVLAFFDLIKKKNQVIIKEFLFNSDSSFIKDIKGNPYTNECVAFALNDASRNAAVAISNADYRIQRIFPLGSEWIYFKIYCGIMTTDRLLSEQFTEVINNLLKVGAIKKWFFIRYFDSDFHIRIRIEVTNKTYISDVLSLMHDNFAPLLKENIITKIQTDTYIRELERYGEDTISHAETLFFYDSEFILSSLKMLGSEKGLEIRWKVAIRAVDEFLDNFSLSAIEKYNLISSLSEQFFKEHGGDKQLKVILDNKFRKLRINVEEVLDRNNDSVREYFSIIKLLDIRGKKVSAIAEELIVLRNNNRLELPLENLLASYLHMNLDRIFMGRNRTNEMVVYNLLAKYYKSTVAKQKAINESMKIVD